MNACQKCEYNSYFSGMERNGTVVKTPLNVIPEWKIFKSFNLVKILKIPKKKSETVNTIQSNDRQYNRSTDNTVERQTIQSNDRQYSRTTDNTIADGKKTKAQTMIYKTIHRKLKIDQRELHKKKAVMNKCPGRESVPATLLACCLAWKISYRKERKIWYTVMDEMTRSCKCFPTCE